MLFRRTLDRAAPPRPDPRLGWRSSGRHRGAAAPIPGAAPQRRRRFANSLHAL